MVACIVFVNCNYNDLRVFKRRRNILRVNVYMNRKNVPESVKNTFSSKKIIMFKQKTMKQCLEFKQKLCKLFTTYMHLINYDLLLIFIVEKKVIENA